MTDDCDKLQELIAKGQEAINEVLKIANETETAMTDPTLDEMLEEAARREAANEMIVAKVSAEDLKKVQAEKERQELAKKTFEELTKDEKIKLALEELAAMVMGGQDGEEYYNSVKFIKEVLESFKDA